MKSYAEWVEEDVERLIADRVPEDFHLDYKKSDSLLNNDNNKNSLGKDVSAFANSDGGVLIYGVEEDKDHFPISIDGGLSPQQTTKEWIEQVIHGKIRRQVPDLLIRPIELKKSNPGHFIYIVQVPPSRHAPHMAVNRYYRRNNFESVPMEEYEVRTLYLRGDAPDLTFELSLNKPRVELDWFERKPGVLAHVVLHANVTNLVSRPALYTQVKIDVQDMLSVRAMPPWIGPVGMTQIEFEGHRVRANRFIHNRAVPNQMPIWDGTTFDVCEGVFMIGVPYNIQRLDSYVIQWSISSPGMQMREGIEWLVREGDMLHFQPA